jgi:hypothetical protein
VTTISFSLSGKQPAATNSFGKGKDKQRDALPVIMLLLTADVEAWVGCYSSVRRNAVNYLFTNLVLITSVLVLTMMK